MMHRKVQSTVFSTLCRGVGESFLLHKPALSVTAVTGQHGSSSGEASSSHLCRIGVSATREDPLRARAPWVAPTLGLGKFVGALASNGFTASAADRRGCFNRLAFERVCRFGEPWHQQASSSDGAEDGNSSSSPFERLVCERECAPSKILRSSCARTYDDDVKRDPWRDWFAIATTHSTLFIQLQLSSNPLFHYPSFIHAPLRQSLFPIPFVRIPIVLSSPSRQSISRLFVNPPLLTSLVHPTSIQSSTSHPCIYAPFNHAPRRQSFPPPSVSLVLVPLVQSSASLPVIHAPSQLASYLSFIPFIRCSSTQSRPACRLVVDFFGKIFFLPRQKKPPDDAGVSGLVTIQCGEGSVDCC